MELPAYSDGVCEEEIVALSAIDSTDLHTYNKTPSTFDLCCSAGITQGDPTSDLISACAQTRANFNWDDTTATCSADIEAANPNDANSPFLVEGAASQTTADCCSRSI